MITDQQIIEILQKKGVYFLTGGEGAQTEIPDFSEEEILVRLAQHADARMRLSLIAVFMCVPSLADTVAEVVQHTNTATGVTLEVYYTAAVLLSEFYAQELDSLQMRPSLCDHFSKELGLVGKTSEEKLLSLGQIYEVHSRRKANWAGTFHHAAQRVIQRKKREQEWMKTH